MKKQGIYLIIIAGVIFFVAAAASIKVFSQATSGLDMSIDGKRISKEEYLACMKSVEYETKIQIQQEYGTGYDKEFWIRQYGDCTGYEILAENTVERLKYIHAVYEIGAQNGDVSDSGYEAVKKRWETENIRRSEVIESGGVVYGLQEYTFDLYLQYEMSVLKETYCNNQSREGMNLTEEEMLEYYNSRDWIFGRDAQKADFDTARIAVERELREQKYDNMVMQRAENFKVDGDMESVAGFTLKNIK
ncbi:MAG: hypothetical protein ACI4VG_08195 [Lachnospiraceae bacterium]